MEGSNTRVGVWLQIETAEISHSLSSNHRLEAKFATEQTSEGFRKVVEMPHFESLTSGCYNHSLLITAATRQSLETFSRIAPRSFEIQIGSAYTTEGRISLWSMEELVEAHPPYQWRRSRGSLTLPLGKKSFAAIAIQHWDYKRKFVIVIGTTSTAAKTNMGGVQNSRYNDGLFCYWIVPSLEQSYGSGRLSVEKYQKYLHMLCVRAASFKLKDYYEKTTKREDSSKTLRLPSGEFVSASFSQLYFDLSRRICILDFKFERRDKFVHPASEQDYFHIERIQQSLQVPRILINGETWLEIH